MFRSHSLLAVYYSGKHNHRSS